MWRLVVVVVLLATACQGDDGDGSPATSSADDAAGAAAPLDATAPDVGSQSGAAESDATVSDGGNANGSDGDGDGVATSVSVTSSESLAATTEAADGNARPAVVVSEVLYHPVDDEPDAEFVELVNTSTGSVDLAGWCFDGIDRCFDDGDRIEPGQYLVVATTGTDSRLSNGGEEIALLDPDGVRVDVVAYDDRDPWPALADGDGPSLQRRSFDADGSDPGNWIAADPTPGGDGPDAGPPLPLWTDVEHDVSPAPGDGIAVTARLDSADPVVAAEVEMRVGLGDPVAVPIALDDLDDLDDGRVEVALPGQDAGALVRFRLIARTEDGVEGSWPRQGDGAEYGGTTVREDPSSIDTDLPRVQWFMDDDEFAAAVADTSPDSDTEYPVVVAVDGVVFDGAWVTIRGQSSLDQPKKKWRIRLPAGHEATIADATGDVVLEGVDQILLNSSWTDRSFVREILAAEAMQTAGADAPSVFPVQVERNGTFFGLYLMVEAPDDDWRERIGLDDAVVYEVDRAPEPPTLQPANAELPRDEFREIFDKETEEGADDDELREFIRRVTDESTGAAVDWVEDNVDVDDVIELLAAAELVQSRDFQRKNYRLALDDGRWTAKPWDLDLTFGRNFDPSCGVTCDDVTALGIPDTRAGEFFDLFRLDPGLSDRLDARIAELAPVLLDVETVADRIDELRTLVLDEARRDRAVWGTYGEGQDPADAMDEVLVAFVEPQRRLVDEYLATL